MTDEKTPKKISKEELVKHTNLLATIQAAEETLAENKSSMSRFLAGLEHKYGNLVEIEGKAHRICRRGDVYFTRRVNKSEED